MDGLLAGKKQRGFGNRPMAIPPWCEEVVQDMSGQESKMIKANAMGPVVEISLLLPEWQANLLETEAFAKGLSPAKMLRRLLMEHLEKPSAGTQSS